MSGEAWREGRPARAPFRAAAWHQRYRSSRSTKRLVATALVLVVATALGACTRVAPVPDRMRALAVVLVQSRRGSELAVVDLVTFTVSRRVPLRSLCLSIDGDPTSRIVATAQCGGPDRAADNACGIFDPDRDRAVDYVELSVSNPLEVAVAGDKAFLLHGFEQDDGVCTSFVDLGSRQLTDSVHVPSGTSRPARHAGRTVVALPEGLGSKRQLLADVSTIDASPLAALSADAITALAASETAGPLFAVTVQRGSSEAQWRVHRLLSSEPPTAVSVSAVEKGLFTAAVVGDELVLADADGLDMRDPGRTLIFLDAATLQERRRIRIGGMPAAIAGWRGRLLVFDGESGELLMYDPGADTPARRLDLGEEQLGSGDLVVLDTARQ